MKKIKLLFAAMAAMITMGMNAQSWTASAVGEGDFYLYNVGAEGFLIGGNDWGCRASLTKTGGINVTLSNISGDVYSISTNPTFKNCYLGKDGYVDKASNNAQYTTWKFAAVEGLENTYTLQAEAGNGKFIQWDGGTVTTTSMVDAAPSTSAGYWKLVTKTNLLTYLQDNATLTNGLDATFLIQNPNFDRASNTGLWTMDASNKNLAGGMNENFCAESYHSIFTLSQVINGVPNGEYELKAQGFYRKDGSNNTPLPYFYINDGTQLFPLMDPSMPDHDGNKGNSMGDASVEFTNGNYTIDPIHVTVGDGKITLGAKLEGNTGLWCIFDNFTLTYYGIDLSAYETQITTLRGTLTALVEEALPMNATVLSTANTALTETASVAHNQAAMEAAISQLNTAIEAANTSIANYAAAKAYLDKSATLDAAGKSSYAANETVAAVQTAYNNRTLEALTDEQKTAMDAAIIVAAKAQTTAGSDWSLVLVNPGFELGNVDGWTNSGTEAADAQGNKAFDNTQGNFYAERWHKDGTVDLNQTVTDLPSGVYEIGAYLYTDTNDGILYANDIQTSFKTSGWYTVQVAIDANGSIKFGAGCTLTSSTWICMDGFKLTLVSASLPDVTAATGKMNADVAAAQTSAIESYEAGKTVAGYNAALAAIAAAQASVEAYAKLVPAFTKIDAALTAATTATESTGAYEAIKTAYNNGTIADNDIHNQIVAAYAAVIPVIKSQTAANADFTLAIQNQSFEYGDLTGWTVGSSSDTGVRELSNNTYATDNADGDYIFNTWWQGVPLTQTVAGLPNGEYTLTVTVASDKDATIYLLGNDEHNTGTQTEVKTTGIDATFTFLVKQGSATIGVVGSAEDGSYVEAGHWWYKADNFRLVKNRELTAEEAFVAATADDYALLNGNLAKYVLGFEAGEFAPYNNPGLVQAIAAAKAIDQEASNSQESVQAAAEAITSAGAVANETEVNAIYNGDFAIAAHDGASNPQPIGWYRNEGSYTGDGTNVRYVSIPSGVEGNTSAKGLFGKFTMKYGAETGYSLPLKQGFYKLTFSYGGWNEKGARDVQLYNEENTATVEISTVTAANNTAHTTASSWRAYSSLITVPAAGDYTLSFYRQNTTSQNQIVLTDIVLVKATAADFKVALAAEIETASALYNNGANVGAGAFQIPAADGTAMSDAVSAAQTVYDNTDATIEEVIAATESVTAAVEAYKNVELNAPEAEKRYTLTIVEDGKAWNGNAITFMAGARNDQGGYGIKYFAPANKNLAQALKLTHTTGNKYKVSVAKADGNEQYLTTAKLGYNTGANEQIRTTDDASKALEIEIKATVTDGQFQLYNTAASKLIANNNNNDVYTANSANFTVAEAEAAAITINTSAAGWGTVMLPFAVASLPEGVKAYSVSDLKADGKELNLVEVDALEANKPYIIEGAWNETVDGDAQGTALTYTDGLLTGVYKTTEAPIDSYVLQMPDLEDKNSVGFYRVAEGTINVPANRAYLTTAAGVKAFILNGGDTDAIKSVFDGIAAGKIFDLSGRKVAKMQKGNTYIVNGKKVNVK